MKQVNQDKIWDFYQNEAADSFEVASDRYFFFSNKISKLNKTKRILNIGVGVGGLEKILKTRGYDVYSVDPSESSISKLSALLGTDKVHVGYADNLPFLDNFFDCVVMSEVLEHIEEKNIYDSIKEIERVIRKDGFFIGSVPYNENLNESRCVCPRCESVFHRFGHLRSYTMTSIYPHLKPFKNIQVKKVVFVALEHRAFFRKIKGLIRIILNNIGMLNSNQNIFFVCKK